MFAFLLMLALQLPLKPVGCDSALLDKPARTPMSVPPAIVNRAAAFDAIERAARSVGGVPHETSALVWFLIDIEGRVAVAQIARSSGYEVADSAALGAARAFRFQPARHNDKPVCVWMRLPVRFSSGR